MQNNKPSAPSLRLTPCRRPYFVVLLCAAIPFCLYAYVAVLKDRSAFNVIMLIIGIIIASYIWISLHIIHLHPDKITYYSLIGGNRTLYLSEINKWSIRIGVFKYLDRFKPTVRLEIVPSSNGQKKSIIIAIRLFDKKDHCCPK